MKSWQAEGLSLDDKYEIEEYATMMKSFADAATQGDLEQVVRGLEAGAEINSLGERWTGWTALHHAADAGHCAVVRLLLERGADKDRPALDYSAHTPLHMAVAKRHYDCVSALLAAGANTELCMATGCGGTALHTAAALGDPALVSALLGAGADPGAVSEEGSTVLHYLAVSYAAEAAAILQQLLAEHRARVDIDAVDYDGYTPLMRAASVGDAAQVRLLLAAGADTEVKEENFGKTAVRIAEELAHAECVQILSA